MSSEATLELELSILNFPPLSSPPLPNDESSPECTDKNLESFLLHTSFEGWASRKPNAIALDFVHSLSSSTAIAEHSTLTYAGLDAAASNLAAHLRELLPIDGYSSDRVQIVPVYMTTSPELYIAYLGILKAGCAFCPIPQDAPDKRVREILRDIDSPIILGNIPEPLSGPWYPESSDSHQPRSCWVDVAAVSKWRAVAGATSVLDMAYENAYFRCPDIKPDQTAYLLFTSGSTGKPKGVQISHLAATCSIQSHAISIPLPGVCPGDFRWFQFASPTFDPSIMEIFVTLSSGGTLCSAERTLTLTDLEGTINEAKATIMMATPSLAALLRPSRLSTLQSLWTMGEKLNRTVIENFATKVHVNGTAQKQTSRMLVNAYGPTEGAINCTFLAPVEYSVRGSIIGRPLPTCSIFILDPDNRIPKPLPAGFAGELAIGGPQISKGYLSRPKETAKSFVFCPEFGNLYRTGDMARIVWDETGCPVLEFLGRLTQDQVKINGRRVELGEVESVLSVVSGVKEVIAIVANRDTSQQTSRQQIVACIVSSDTDQTERDRIVDESRKNVEKHLPSYMHPSTYAFLDSLPRSSSGKVNRGVVLAKLGEEKVDEITILSAMKPEHVNGIQDDLRSENSEFSAVQQLVIQILTETAGEDISSTTLGSSLYSLGMDSLGAMRFLQKLKDNSITGMSVADVLRTETLGLLVSRILDTSRTRHGCNSNGFHLESTSIEDLERTLESFDNRNRLRCAENLGLKESQIVKVLPTTATQTGMLASFLRTFSDTNFATRSYINHTVLSIASDIDIHRLHEAFDAVISSYDSFRIAFCLIDDNMAPFAQCILAPEVLLPPDWSVYRVLPGDILEDTLWRVARDAEKSISMNKPPWRLSMVTSPDDRTTLILSIFHGIFDGASLQLLLEDITSVYHGKPQKRRTSLERIVKNHFQVDHTVTGKFWRETLQGYSPVPFPSVTSYRPPAVTAMDAVEIIARTSYDQLKRQCRRMDCTPLSVLQAAWGSILLAYTGSQDQDITMGSVVSGRFDTDTEVCTGPAFTIIPTRLALQQVPKTFGDIWTNESVVQYLTAFNAKALSYLQPQLGSLTLKNGQLPYDTILAYQDFSAGSSSSNLWDSIQHPPMAHDFAVMIEVWPGSDLCLTLRAAFDDSHLDRPSAEMMLRQMSHILESILENPEGDFLDAPMNTPLKLKSVMNQDPHVPPEVQEGVLVHTRFEDHAKAHPDDTALIFMRDLDNENSPLNISWTYGELDTRADSLAQYLVQVYGTLTNSAVPICIDKSPAMYVAILGILKAGGAWCPIDTLSPPQRRHDLIARTGAQLLLVSSVDGGQSENSVPTGVDVVDIDRFTGEPSDLLSSSIRGIVPRSTPNDMAYMIWTSGTTGAPKGVPIQHSAAVSAMRSLEKDIPSDVPGGTVRCLQFSQYSFDVSIQDIFYTWNLGGVLISATRELLLGSFARLANITKATHAHLTPAFAAGISRRSCETLQVITMIGEKLTQSVADDWGTGMRAFNTYGPAEVTIVSTVREFGNEHKNIKSANVGWPLETVSTFVTRNQKLIMKNAVGELALGGPQLSTGYLNQPDTTNSKYVWNEEVAQTLYYTGDLVRMLADGSLEYLNRVDDQVKMGGIRVELSEISFFLAQCHPLVDNVETLILNRPDRPMQVIVSFLCAPGAATEGMTGDLLIVNETAAEVARGAGEKSHAVLPGHMLPSVYLVVSHIPRTQSAKTDRRALQEAYATVDIQAWDEMVNPDSSEPTATQHGEAHSIHDKRIIDIIALMASISQSQISTATRLSSLGIDSIRAIRLASRLNEAGYRLSVVDVIHCVTVKDLTKLASSSSSDRTPIGGFDLDDFDGRWHAGVASKIQEDFFMAPATPMQESLLSETMRAREMYWSNHFFSLDASTDLQRLRESWLTVCRSTEALRIGFIPAAEVGETVSDSDDFSILQIIYSHPVLDWELYKYTEANFNDTLGQRLEEIMAKRQENYFRSPPWAVTVFEKENERLMVLTIHHSIHDGPSISFLLDDLQAAYSARQTQRHQLRKSLSVILPTKKETNEASHFWKAELKPFMEADVPVWPDLTGKRVSPSSMQQHKLVSQKLTLSEPVEKLQSMTAKLGISSIASLLRAAWGCVSLNYLGAPATVFGETLSDRVLNASLEDAVGPLISVVPVPFRQTGTVRELLAEQNRLSVQSRKYRHIHSRKIRKILDRPRDQALYPGLFIFHSVNESESSRGNGLWTELEDQVGLHVEHPMAFNAYQDSNGAIVMEAFVDNSIMSSEHLIMYLRQIDAFLSAMLTYPDEQIIELVSRLPRELLSVSTQKESENVLKSALTSPVYWLEFNAERHPDWTAVEVASSITESGIKQQSMTYGSLNDAANRVATFILSLGFKKRMIAVCGRNLASYPVVVGIFKSGNAYLPIDEGLPNERRAFLIEDGNSPLVFTEAAFLDTFADIPDTCRVICFDQPEFQKSLDDMPSDNVSSASDPEDIGYLLYTSGSTGKPKGVMVTRGNLSAFIESLSEFACDVAPATLELGGKGRYLAQASRAFDPHLLEMFFPWRHGMATSTGPRMMLLDDLQLTLSKWNITHASLVPSLLDQTNVDPECCPALKFLTVGGEKITQKVLDTWGASSGVALINAYGPTEATIGCTFALVENETTVRNIGRPLNACVGHVLIPGTSRYALRGQTGEICFSGNLVAKGYLNRPDAKGFVRGPQGERMYRTGDIGRMMVDDSVEYLGRGDDQTKIRGQRLELGEVSEVIRASSSINIQVVTMIAKHPALSRTQLISFIARSGILKRSPNDQPSLLQSDFVTLGKDIHDACKRKLPAYMVPEIIFPITFIPLAPLSGKASIKDLQDLFSSISLATLLRGNNSPVGDSAANRSPTTDELAVIRQICSLISTDTASIGPLTNIFEIGLDSLSAIGLSVKLRNIGFDATVARVLSNPIVEQLAQLPRRMDSDTGSTDNSALKQKLLNLESEFRRDPPPNIDLSSILAVRPCLPLQEGLVARSMNMQGAQLYVNHVVLQLNHSIDPDRLKEAWRIATTKHEILRISFAPVGAGIAQVVHSVASEMRWVEEWFDSVDEAVSGFQQQEEELAREIIDEIFTVPPLRFRLARSSINQEPLILSIAIHHALYDGQSFSMVLEDVAGLYLNKPVSERGSPSDFIDYVYSQDLEKSKQYWVTFLADCKPTIFRTDSLAVENPSSAHRTLETRLSALEHRSASLHTTVPSLMQAIFALLLADTVGVSDVTYGVVLSGRAVSVPGAESVLLPCITTIPGRLRATGLASVNETIEYTQKATARSLEFQHTPLRHIQSWLMSEAPLFDCLFSYVRPTKPTAHGLWRDIDSNMPADYPFAVEVEADNSVDQIHIHCRFTSSFGSSYSAAEFLEKMDVLLSSIAHGEDTSLDNFNLSQSDTRSPAVAVSEWDDKTWSATETKVRELVSRFCKLDLEHVTKGASFLSLGIDSVGAIQFARELRQSSFPASSSDVMRFPRVGELARRLDQLTCKAAGDDQIPPNPSSVRDLDAYRSRIRALGPDDSISALFECTPLQSAMITQTLGSAGSVYVYPHIVQISDTVDPSLLRDAVLQVIRRNDILRTSFHPIPELGYSWAGAVHSNPPLEWTETSLPDDIDIIVEMARRFKFDSESTFEIPPLRTALVTKANSRFLVVVMHHALYDGVSAPFILEDIAMVYQGTIPPDRPQFSDTVRHVLQGKDTACEFWKQKLLGYEAIGIPPLWVGESSDRMFSVERRIVIDISELLRVCREIEVTVQTISLLAYAKVLACLVGKRDVVFGHVLAGRSLPVPGVERTIGPLFNTVAQRITLEPKFLSNKSLARRLQQMNADAQDHQHASLRVIQNMLRKSGSLKAESLFDTLFVFQKYTDSTDRALDEQKIWTSHEPPDFVAEAEHKLNVEVDHGPSGIVVRATSKGKYLSQDMLNKVVVDFEEAFRDIVEHPTRCSTIFPEQLGKIPLQLSGLYTDESTTEGAYANIHEPLIQQILAEVAGVPFEAINPDTSIFSIGLDSLSAICIAAVCRSKGLKAGVADILQGSTLRGISSRIHIGLKETIQPKEKPLPDLSRTREDALQRLNLSDESVEAVLPCLSGQNFHLVSWRKSGRTLFEPAWCYYAKERVDPEQLEGAWFKLRQRHPILRTCFVAVSPSEAVQVVLREPSKNGQVFGFVDYAGTTIKEAAKNQAKEEAMRPSSLSTPPVRLRLIRAQDQDGIMMLVNHAAYDAWTMPMFVSELAGIYHNQPFQSNPDFPSFVNYSMHTLLSLDEEKYWTSAVGSSQPTIVKRDKEPLCSHTPPEQLFVGIWEKVKNLSQMETICRASGLGVQTVVLLAVSRSLARLTNTGSPTFGLYQTGRSASFHDIERLSGPCLNVTPFTVDEVLSGNDRVNLLSKAQSIQSSLAERVPYEQSSLRDILLRWASTKNTKTPLFNTWINLLWMQQKSSADSESNDMFQPLAIGVPTDFIPAEPLPSAMDTTSVALLDTSYLPDGNVYIDIGPDVKTDSIGFGIRVEGGILSETGVHSLVTDIAEEIERIVSLLALA